MLGDDTTAQRLRLFQAEFTQHVRTGPGDGRSSHPAFAPVPLDLAVIDRIRAAASEIETHTRAEDPAAGHFTGDATRVYDWAREHTAHLAPERQAAREAIIYRQGLELAIAMGDATAAIRPHPCPQCGCYGLFWDTVRRAAVCVNRYCVDEDGLCNTWQLKRLAYEHVARENGSVRRAT